MYPVVFSSFSHHIPTNYWLYSSMDFLHVYVCWFCWLNFHVCCVSWWLKHPPMDVGTVLGIITAHFLDSALPAPVPSPNESWWIGCVYPFPVPGCLDPDFLVDLHMDLMVILIGNIYWRAFKPGRILGGCYNVQTNPDLLTDGKGKKEESCPVKWQYHWDVDI
jgi:hypothetical protein